MSGTDEHVQRVEKGRGLPTVEQVLAAFDGLALSHPLNDRHFRRSVTEVFVSVRCQVIHDLTSKNGENFLWILLDWKSTPQRFFALPHSVAAPLLTDDMEQPWLHPGTKTFKGNRWCILPKTVGDRHFLYHKKVGKDLELPPDFKSRRADITAFLNRTDLIEPVMRLFGLWR